MLATQNCFQNHIKNDKSTKFLLQSAFYASKESTRKVLPFYGFWFKFYDKFCSPYSIVAFLRIFIITKFRNRNLNVKEIFKSACIVVAQYLAIISSRGAYFREQQRPCRRNYSLSEYSFIISSGYG